MLHKLSQLSSPDISESCVLLFSFFFESSRGLKPQTEFVFDLELSSSFVPQNNDGEVDGFELVPIADVAKKICSDEYKTTSCPIAIDFLVRHGVVHAENGEVRGNSIIQFVVIKPLLAISLPAVRMNGAVAPSPVQF
jgi:hypothetical protein